MNKEYIKELSIQIHLSGLSFCILNKTLKTIELLDSVSFTKKRTPFEVQEKLEAYLDSNQELAQAFSSVLVIHQNELANFVPKPLFNEDHLADYLKFSSKILKSDYLAFDEILANNSVNVYVPYVNINNAIFDRFGAFEYKHAASIMATSVLALEPNTDQPVMYANIASHHFEILVVQNKALLLYNSFEYQTNEDVIYYLLFTAEQLKVSPETTPLYVTGLITEDDALYKTIYTYVRHIHLWAFQQHYAFTDGIAPTTNHEQFIILNSFS